MPLGEGAFLRQTCNPAAAAHKGDSCLPHDAELAGKNLVRQVLCRRVAELGTVVAMMLIAGAVHAVVADSSIGPLVMQRPHNPLAALEDSVQLVQGEETLIDPMQMDDIGLKKGRMAGDVCAGIGYVHIPQHASAHTVVQPYHKPFPHELQPQGGRLGQGCHAHVRSGTIAHQHAGIRPVGTQSIHQAQRRNGRSTSRGTRIYNQHFHLHSVFPFLESLLKSSTKV